MTKKVVKITEKQTAALQTKNVADSIRYLDDQGYSRADIARILGKRYQHVRNVLEHKSPNSDGKTKTTYTLRADLFSEFDRYIKEIGLRRDSYLNSILPNALSELGQAERNSESTQELLRETYRPGAHSPYEQDDFVRVNLSLDSKLVERMNTECAAKRIPRDLFLEGVLEVANAALGHAAETFQYPIDFCKAMGINFCGDFLMSDAEASEFRQELLDELLVAQAIAQVKNIAFGIAQRSYFELSRGQRKQLKNHPDIQKAIDCLKTASISPVNLDNFLEAADKA